MSKKKQKVVVEEPKVVELLKEEPKVIVEVPKEKPKKLILSNPQSPGDILMLTAAIRDLHLSYPGKYLTDVRTSCGAFFENSPYITKIDDADPEAQRISCEYPLINKSNTIPLHFIHGFRKDLQEKLKITIQPTDFKGDIHISDLEKSWFSQIRELVGEDIPYWIIVSGGKSDYTAKHWSAMRCQEVIDYFAGRMTFVQVGEATHMHPPLERCINLLGKTDLRQLVRLVYHSSGIVCPVTALMHLAAAVPTKEGMPKNRPAVVVAGGREPSQWEAYPHHRYLAVNGALSCADNGGCWKSRVIPLNDGDSKDNSLCLKPVISEGGQIIPKCMEMIRAYDVCRAIEQFLEFYN